MKQSGCLAIGGDHITNDLSLGLRIPMAKAEKLKVEEGSVVLGSSLPGEMVVLKDETGFAGKEVEREMLNTIIHCRVRETFELLKRDSTARTTCDFPRRGHAAHRRLQPCSRASIISPRKSSGCRCTSRTRRRSAG